MFENFDNTNLREDGYTRTFLLEDGTQVPANAEPRLVEPASDCPHAVALSDEYGLTVVRNLNPQGSSGVRSWQVLDASGERRVLKAWVSGNGKRAQSFRAAYGTVQERPGLTRVMPLVHARFQVGQMDFALLDWVEGHHFSHELKAQLGRTRKILRSLGVLAEEGVVHCDLNPGNTLENPDHPYARLIDLDMVHPVGTVPAIFPWTRFAPPELVAEHQRPIHSGADMAALAATVLDRLGPDANRVLPIVRNTPEVAKYAHEQHLPLRCDVAGRLRDLVGDHPSEIQDDVARLTEFVIRTFEVSTPQERPSPQEALEIVGE